MNIIQPENPISEKDLNQEIGEAKNRQYDSEKKYGKPTTALLVGIIVLIMILSSLFGALFGFMSGSAASIFSSKIEQKLSKYFPKYIDKEADYQTKKQQVIIEDSAIIDVVEKTSPAVVSIIITKDVPNISNNSFGFFDPFFGGDPFYNTPRSEQGGTTKQEVGGGSGFFITSDGLILTNKHVVEDQQASYTVVTNEGKKYQASILARDPARDVAVIKIDGSNFPTLSLGNSDSLKIGQTTIAIGNSLGEFINSVSRGIVSGLKRTVEAGSGFGSTERLTDIIQTDAAINPGNSGGPLLDIQGNVIGINVAMAQGAQNVGFALPINQATRLIEQAKGGAKVSIPFIGVRYIVINSSVQKEAQLPFDYGVLVLRGNKMTELAVVPGSPADKAGIVENDIILEVNGKKISEDNQLADVISRYNVGDRLTLKVWHKGEIKDLQLTLQESNK